MMKSVKHTFSNIGDTSGDVARMIGDTSVDIARMIGSTSSDVARMIGSETAHLARRSAKIAKRVGPRNGLIGLAAVAAVVGGSVLLVRYLRARSAAANAAELEADEQTGIQGGAKRNNKQRTVDASIQH